MNLVILLRSAFNSLKHRKMRSLLTTLGIVIGIVAIIAVMSLGEGAKHKVQKEIEKLGSNFIIVLAASPKSVTQRGVANFTLKPSDIQAIKEEIPDVAAISPGVMYTGLVIHEGSNWQTGVYGINELYFDIRQWGFSSGENITLQDVRSGNKVAVLGKTVAQELFKDKSPIGHIIRIKKIPFKVIGVLAEKGSTPDGRDLDDAVFCPVTTVQHKLLGKSNYNILMMSAISKDHLASAAREVRLVLRQTHRLQEGDDDDFSIFTQDDISQATQAASMVLNLLLLIIASISLIVGGIGIMNIMLVIVTERTKEIGIRMALGATRSNILKQFIFEAIAICLLGGLLGVGVGVLISHLVSFGLGWPVFISYKAVCISLSSSILIGVFFGYYPARKASLLNPVEALIEQ
jgi:putative ABC transport system permease protein